jgi:RNA polymerase sigma factor (sigma-70 family)
MANAKANLLQQVHQLMATERSNPRTDRQLLERFATQGDESAFSLLVRRHGSMVFGTCRRALGHEQDAEDAFQATFLILARKAGSIRQTDVGGFLHRVAHHLAVRARGLAVKRRRREQRRGTVPVSDPLADVTWREVRQVVDEELQRLSDALRSAVVLCYLEGKTHEEAARLLGWSKNRLRRRLGQGRELLRERLLARGLAPAAALTATLFAEGVAPAAVPAALASATMRTVLSRNVSPVVAELANAGLEVLSVSKTKVAMALVLTVTALTGAGLWARGNLAAHAVASPTQAASPVLRGDDKRKTATPKEQAAQTVKVHGRVLGPDGKPKAGAKLLLLGPLDPVEQQELLVEGGKVQQLGISATDGRFTVAIPKKPQQQFLVARADGLGIDFLDLDARILGKTVELRLVKDHMIRGRIVNTEGKPVGGVRVAVNHLGVYPNNSLDSFLVFWKNRPFNSGLRGGVKNVWSGAGALLNMTTDADGCFALHGVGEERLVSLRFGGAGIAATEGWVVNRAGFDAKPYNQATRDNLPKGEKGFFGESTLSGPDVSIVAASEKVIRGVVTERDTGKARPGVLVRLTRKNGDDRSGGDYLSLSLQAKTDAKGRYVIHGAAKAKSYLVSVASDSMAGYLGRAVWAEDTLGYRPVTADICVRKGVIVTGKMIDRATKKPIPGFVLIADLFDNPFVKEYSDDSFHTVIGWAMDFRGTDAGGVFRAVTIPGPVLLMGGPLENRSVYKSFIPDPKYPRYFEKRGDHYGYHGSGSTIVQGNFCKVLQLKPGVAVVTQDIVLERRDVLGVVKIQDAEGRPLHEVDAWGVANQIEDDSCTLYGEASEKPRLLVLYQPKRNLAGALSLKAGEKLPLTVKLGPMGSVKGQLLDAAGKPLAGVVVDPRYRDSAANGIHGRIHEAKPIATDASGTFTLENVIPELKFELSFHRGKQRFEREGKPADALVQVKPSESRDLGAIELKLVHEKAKE